MMDDESDGDDEEDARGGRRRGRSGERVRVVVRGVVVRGGGEMTRQKRRTRTSGRTMSMRTTTTTRTNTKARASRRTASSAWRAWREFVAEDEALIAAGPSPQNSDSDSDSDEDESDDGWVGSEDEEWGRTAKYGDFFDDDQPKKKKKSINEKHRKDIGALEHHHVVDPSERPGSCGARSRARIDRGTLY